VRVADPVVSAERRNLVAELAGGVRRVDQHRDPRAADRAMFQENPERVRLRDAIVSANADLRERELIKLATFALAVADALRDRGITEPTASLAAETGVAVFKVAFARWVSEPGQPDLPRIFRESMAELRGVVEDCARV
jgi:hypothetical protein